MANSFRVVNQGAGLIEFYIKQTGDAFEGYRKADTTEIDEDWRPEDWDKIKLQLCKYEGCVHVSKCIGTDCRYFIGKKIEATFSACLEALGRVKGK